MHPAPFVLSAALMADRVGDATRAATIGLDADEWPADEWPADDRPGRRRAGTHTHLRRRR